VVASPPTARPLLTLVLTPTLTLTVMPTLTLMLTLAVMLTVTVMLALTVMLTPAPLRLAKVGRDEEARRLQHDAPLAWCEQKGR
jgi:hypothetical protein